MLAPFRAGPRLMGKGLTVFLVILAIVVAVLTTVGYQRYRDARDLQERQDKQVAELGAQVGRLEAENRQLKTELSRVQDEQIRLVADNQVLRKALENAKLTGKVSDLLPYPPK